MTQLLNKEFAKEELLAFDVNLYERPQKISDAVKSFWGGYLIEFKVIQQNKFNALKGDIESIRRNAIPLHADNSTKFTIDISKYEYIAGKRPRDIEGAVVYVYSPEMLALEKLRALCQQIPNYKEVVLSMSPRSRARDFYDIHNLVETFKLDFTTSEHTQLCGHIFETKHVPLSYIAMLPEYRDFHRQSWPSVVSTINQMEAQEDFDFYFDYTINCCGHLAHSPLG
ncbi:MAG: hypothetical protein GC205_06275 [Bacteroidetes bacterium]|nr:hypothetical protein [Bacteroidota bacterium]